MNYVFTNQFILKMQTMINVIQEKISASQVWIR